MRSRPHSARCKSTAIGIGPGTITSGQSKCCAAISRRGLANALGVREFISDTASRATNEEAYELYLKSIALNWDNKTDNQAIDLLRRAVLLDPNFAPAWGMLALRYYGAARFGGGGPEMMALSDAAAKIPQSIASDSLQLDCCP